MVMKCSESLPQAEAHPITRLTMGYWDGDGSSPDGVSVFHIPVCIDLDRM